MLKDGCDYFYYAGIGCFTILAASKVVEWYLILYCASVDLPIGIPWKRYISRYHVIGRLESIEKENLRLMNRVGRLERKDDGVIIHD